MENEFVFVDLGLPSGILWADKNAWAHHSYQGGAMTPFDEINEWEEFLPTYDEFAELINLCDFSSSLVQSPDGSFAVVKVTGPNGNYIYLPTVDSIPGLIGDRVIGLWSQTAFGSDSHGFMLVQLSALILSFYNIDNITIGVTTNDTPRMVRFVKRP